MVLGAGGAARAVLPDFLHRRALAEAGDVGALACLSKDRKIDYSRPAISVGEGGLLPYFDTIQHLAGNPTSSANKFPSNGRWRSPELPARADDAYQYDRVQAGAGGRRAGDFS